MFLPNFEILLIFINFLRYFLRYKISNPVFLVVKQASTDTFNCQNIMTKAVLKTFMSILYFLAMIQISEYSYHIGLKMENLSKKNLHQPIPKCF